MLRHIQTNMDKRVNAIIEKYFAKFKDDIRDYMNTQIHDEKIHQGLRPCDINQIIQFVYDYNRLVITPEEISPRRKRVSNVIPGMNRCSAKRASGEQCTRRRAKGCDFCGTHQNSTPNGQMTTEEENEQLMKLSNQQIEISAEDVDGIIYHVDTFNNVYNTEDILKGSDNPRIIGTFKKPTTITLF
jgi:hypothetical protein